MQATPHRCPGCNQPIWISNDMWGPYYLCQDCGWTAEDDDDLSGDGDTTALLLDAADEARGDAGHLWST